MNAAAFTYTNYKGETALRRVEPLRIEFGGTEFHPQTQWLLVAWDLDKGAERTFALADIRDWRPLRPSELATVRPRPGSFEGLKPRVFYRRREDMSPDGSLTVLFEDDGDAIVTVRESKRPRLNTPIASVQFFCTLAGGGKSQRVRAAIVALAKAIKEENEADGRDPIE